MADRISSSQQVLFKKGDIVDVFSSFQESPGHVESVGGLSGPYRVVDVKRAEDVVRCGHLQFISIETADEWHREVKPAWGESPYWHSGAFFFLVLV